MEAGYDFRSLSHDHFDEGPVPMHRFGRLLLAISTLNAMFLTEASAESKPPNILLIMCDDLGWGDVGFNGNRQIKTPHLDRWAQQGVVLERFYAASPVCSPTRGSCLTGRHPHRYGIFHANRGHLPDAEVTLAEALRQRGYATGHFGKWHLGTLTTQIKESNRGGPQNAKHFAPPWQHGFDICFSTEAKVPTWDPMKKPPNASRLWWDPIADEDAVEYGTYYWSGPETRVRHNLAGDDSRVIVDRAIPFIEENTLKEHPFLAVVWLHAPHLPVVAGPKYTQLYKGHTKYEQHYFGCISALDNQIGRLLDKLTELNIVDNTFVLFCSDNGPEGKAGNAPGTAASFRGRKRDLFEGGIRVPAFASWPNRIPKNRRIAVPMVTSDLFPTLCAEASRSKEDINSIGPQPLDGIKLMPILVGEINKRNRGIGFQFTNQTAWIEDRYKLIHRGDRKYLFDLLEDPGETNNLADQIPAILARLDHELQRWIRSCQQSQEGADYKP